MLFVNHVVPGLQLQRVDAAAPPARHPAHIPGGGQSGRVPGQVALGDQGQLDRGPDEAVLDTGRGDVRHARFRRPLEVLQPSTDPLAAQRLGQPLCRAVTLGDQHDPPVLGQPGPDVGEHAGRIAAIGG